MPTGEILIFIISFIGIILIPNGFRIYKTTDLTAGGILTMLYGVLCLVVTLGGLVKLLS